jgi:hypothetical protein
MSNAIYSRIVLKNKAFIFIYFLKKVHFVFFLELKKQKKKNSFELFTKKSNFLFDTL